jgi:hypothetical protein
MQRLLVTDDEVVLYLDDLPIGGKLSRIQKREVKRVNRQVKLHNKKVNKEKQKNETS